MTNNNIFIFEIIQKLLVPFLQLFSEPVLPFLQLFSNVNNS